MENFRMYSKIQQERNQGFSREAAARHLDLSWRTVDRYWDMTVDEYKTLQEKQFSSNLSKHESVIVDWLERFPDLSAAQVSCWVYKNYGKGRCSSHAIGWKTMNKLVLEDIRRNARAATLATQKYVDMLIAAKTEKKKQETDKCKRELKVIKSVSQSWTRY